MNPTAFFRTLAQELNVKRVVVPVAKAQVESGEILPVELAYDAAGDVLELTFNGESFNNPELLADCVEMVVKSFRRG